jgi:hypothetical protein
MSRPSLEGGIKIRTSPRGQGLVVAEPRVRGLILGASGFQINAQGLNDSPEMIGAGSER